MIVALTHRHAPITEVSLDGLIDDVFSEAVDLLAQAVLAPARGGRSEWSSDLGSGHRISVMAPSGGLVGSWIRASPIAETLSEYHGCRGWTRSMVASA